MITPLYAALSALLIVYLSLNVVKQRRTHRVAYNDGGVEALSLCRAAQSCCVEYLPISLILLLALELAASNLSVILLHGFGIVMLLSRVMHVRSLLTKNLKLRVVSMHLTFYTIIGMAILNIIYFVI